MKRRSLPTRALLCRHDGAVLGACTPSDDPGPPAPRTTSETQTPAGPSASPTPADPVSLRVVFVEALEDDEPDDRVTAAFQGARLAFSNAELVAGLPWRSRWWYTTRKGPRTDSRSPAGIASRPRGRRGCIGAPG